MDREKIFQKNLQLWIKTCPKQAVMLPYADCSNLNACQTAMGEPNLVKTDPSCDAFYYHDQRGAFAEAEQWFASLNLNKVSLVFVYGVGLGYYYDAIAPWLKKDRRRRLVFLEDDLGVIHKLLETEKGTQILQNPQVQLVYFNGLQTDEDVFEMIYWNFAMTRMAVSSLKSYFEHKQAVFAELKQKLSYDAAMKNALVDEYMRYGARFYINFYPNMLHLPTSYLGNRFFGKFTNIPAIICGAGPSLGKNLSLLGKLTDRALIFAGGSAMNVLNAGGIQPHFGAGIDPNPMQFKRLSENQAFEVPFFYRNRLFDSAFKMIHGPRLYVTGAGGYDTAEFFEKKLNIQGDFLDEGHNVVNFCVEVAHAMGCNPIIFAGMDLAFTGMKEYAPGVVEDAAISQSSILDIDDQDAKAVIRNDIEGKPTYTLWKWIAEADWIGSYAKTHPSIMMFNCTEGGLGFPGIPNKTLEEIAKKYLGRSYELKNRIHGETQNSSMPKVTYSKVSRIMKELEKSLERVIGYFNTVIEDAKINIEKIKKGADAISQSGLAALAETELTEEPAYRHVIEVFNEVYARMLSGEVHEIKVRRLSDKQKLQKKLDLGLKKYHFLRDVALINREIIKRTFKQVKRKKSPYL
jgi:hypothetical protein